MLKELCLRKTEFGKAYSFGSINLYNFCSLLQLQLLLPSPLPLPLPLLVVVLSAVVMPIVVVSIERGLLSIKFRMALH